MRVPDETVPGRAHACLCLGVPAVQDALNRMLDLSPSDLELWALNRTRLRGPRSPAHFQLPHPAVLATISAIEAQSPDYCSQVACLLALNGIQHRTVLTHLPLEWPFLCLNFRFSRNDVANLSPLQRIAIAEALRCWLPGGDRRITPERVPPELLLQPLLHWVSGVAHFLASVCHKGREVVQLEPSDLLAGLLPGAMGRILASGNPCGLGQVRRPGTCSPGCP